MSRGASHRIRTAAYWIEGVLFAVGFAYWLFVDPKHLLQTPLFWSLLGLAGLVAVIAIVEYFISRREPDPLASIDRRAEIDTSVRTKWR